MITKAEDKIVNSASDSGIGQAYPLRPSFGSAGQNVVVWANYFEMKVPSNLSIHQYAIGELDLKVTPKQKALIIHELMAQCDGIANLVIVTDFKSYILSMPTEMPGGPLISKKVKYPPTKEGETPKNQKEYQVPITYGKAFHLSDLSQFLASTDPSAVYPAKDELVQALNILRNYHPQTSGNVVTVGAHKVFSPSPQPSDTIDLKAGLKGVKGFFASVRLATSRVLVNVNVSHAAFYEAKAGRLSNLIQEYRGGTPRGRGVAAESALLKRVKVQPDLTIFEDGNSRLVHGVRTIWGYATKDDGRGRGGLPGLPHPPKVPKFAAGANEVAFWYEREGEAGAYITVENFFKMKYSKVLRSPYEPVLNVGTLRNPVYLPVEVCKVPAGQVAKVKLSPDQMAKMIELSASAPGDNARQIESSGLKLTGLDTSDESTTKLKASGFRVTPGLIAVAARVLVPPRVSYKASSASIRNASWNMRNNQFRKGVRLAQWSYILLSTPGQQNRYDHYDQDQRSLINDFKRELTKTGISYNAPVELQSHSVQLRNETDADEVFKESSKSKTKIDLLLVVLPDRVSATVYSAIKGHGDLTYGIATICVNGGKLRAASAKAQYIANMAMKFNLKLGGDNHSINFGNTLGNILTDTMIVGIDVTHPSPSSSEKAPSIAGMVASVDSSLGQWPAVIRRQGPREEMVADLEEMLSTRLKLWRSKGRNGYFPKNILVYRDGVSEGQYPTVIKEELPRLRQACTNLYTAEDQKKGYPHITIVIVGKRHHTRFYPTREQDATPSPYNTLPGTVVDRGVTEARNWDFFLQPHYPIKGTARPIHYFVIHDEMFSEIPRHKAADLLEELTHSLCYVYGRATKAVSVATPAYYADIVCERARCYLNRLFDDSFSSDGKSTTGSQVKAGESTEGGKPSEGGKSSAGGNSGEEDKPSAGGKSNDEDKENQKGIQIHPNLVNSMFYI